MAEKKQNPKLANPKLNGFPCDDCGSTNTIAHTDSDLRWRHLLAWQCLDCDKYTFTGWDIDG